MRLTKEEWELIESALADLTMDAPGTWAVDLDLEARLAAYRRLREKVRRR